MSFIKKIFSKSKSQKCSECGNKLVVLPEAQIKQLAMEGSDKAKKVANRCGECGQVFCVECAFKAGVVSLGLNSLACPKCHSTAVLPLE
jgi:uncharacterized protein with PIN domain